MNTKITKEGWMVANEDSHISRWVCESGRLDHDSFLTPLACAHIKKGHNVLDCGANIGTHTVAYSRAAGETGKVFAVEAGNLAYHCLVHNASKFPIQNVTTIQAAIEHLPGFLFSHHENPNLGASKVRCARQVEPDCIYSVSVDSLRRHFKVTFDFIKFDIEGWEQLALFGAKECLALDKPVLLIEINSEALMIQGGNPKTIVTYLEAMGYDWKPVQETCTLESPQFDIICTPKTT